MIDTILQFDASLFHQINQEWTHDLLNYLMPVIRNKYTWLPLYVFLISFLLINFHRKGLILLGAVVCTFILTDTLSSRVIKPSVERSRPCKTYSAQAAIRVHCGSGYSFTSSHAANHFGLSFSLIWLLNVRSRWVVSLLVFWAAVVSYAQVYVGVHYPMDVVAGGLLGIMCALVISKLYKFSGLVKY